MPISSKVIAELKAAVAEGASKDEGEALLEGLPVLHDDVDVLAMVIPKRKGTQGQGKVAAGKKEDGHFITLKDAHSENYVVFIGGPSQGAGSTTPQGKTAQANFRAVEGGRWKAERASRNLWKLENGVEVQMYSPSDPEWKRAETQRRLGVVRYGDQEVEIVADDWYNDATKRNKLPSASDRDALIEQAVIPVLQATNPEHLKGLAWIRFDGVKGGNASGNYLAFSNENITDPKKIGGITITAWHEYVGRDNAAGLR